MNNDIALEKLVSKDLIKTTASIVLGKPIKRSQLRQDKLDEFYIHIQKIVETNIKVFKDRELKTIENRINRFSYDNNKKITRYKEIIDSIELKDSFDSTTNLTPLDFYNSENWKSSVLECFEGNYSIYLDFIEGRKVNIVNMDVFNNWLETAKDLETVELCKFKINELKNSSNNHRHTKQVNLTSFESKLSLQQFKYLYKALTQSHTFINDIKTDEADFLNVFTKEFDGHDSKIHFSKETTQIAYIFYLLKTHFTYLYKYIGISKKFISEDGTIITSNNISSQLSKTIKKGFSVKNQDIINEILNNIPKE